jgi:phosphoesterase RecJ-like protein
MPEDLHTTMTAALQGAQRILAVSHIRPDGDATGSLLGFGLALRQAGKQVDMVLSDGVPANLRHLPGARQVLRHAEGDYTLTVVLDASDLARTGEALGGRPVDINIDHHITNLNFARINLVETQAVATAAILAEHLPRWGFPIQVEAASALLTGIITDTIGFRTSNMTPQALRLAAGLMESGADLPELYRTGLVQKTFEAVRYWGFGLERLQREDGLAWTTLLATDRQTVGYNGNDDADLVNFLSSTDAEIVVLFNEQKDGRVKVSWRARPGLDVSGLALSFGGGGHPAAAGVELPGPLDQVQQRVLDATRAAHAAQTNADGSNERQSEVT